MSYGLTKTQNEVLSFVRDYIAMNKVAPTYEEIARGFGWRSKSSVHRIVSDLEQRGKIRRLPNRERAMSIVDDDYLGEVAERLIREWIAKTGESRDAIIRTSVVYYLGSRR